MNARKQLRQMLHKVPDTHGIDRLMMLEKVADLAQSVHDEELLALTEKPGGQSALARDLGISRQAVSMRVQHARKRLERTQQDAR